jgi:hypothetical protein
MQISEYSDAQHPSINLIVRLSRVDTIQKKCNGVPRTKEQILPLASIPTRVAR